MLLTGELIDAHRAADWGLVNRVVAASQLRAETLQLAERIAAASELVVALGKQAFYAQIDLPQPAAYASAIEVMTMNSLAQDAKEGIASFLGKRTPAWIGR
jgi:enoyl-CoA hydratase/carnithine racemase